MKNKKSIQKIKTFNNQGLLFLSKQQTQADDFQRYKMIIFCVQETHLREFGAKNLTANSGKNFLLCYCGNLSKSINGVAMMIKPNRQVEFEPISEKICKMTIKLDSQNNSLVILSAYEPPLDTSEKNPEQA